MRTRSSLIGITAAPRPSRRAISAVAWLRVGATAAELGAQQVEAEVPVAQTEPGGLAEPPEHLQGAKGLVAHPEAGRPR